MIGLPLALIARGRARLSQVTGSSSCRVPWSMTPLSALPSRQRTTVALLPSGLGESLGAQERRFGAVLTRPVPSRTYASPDDIAAPWRKARYRPAGLGFGRTGFAPVGRHSEFHESPHVFIPFRPALPGRTAERALPEICFSAIRMRSTDLGSAPLWRPGPRPWPRPRPRPRS